MHDIICAHCEDILPGMKDDSVDLIVTDPPFGWLFMGSDWDRAVPSVEIWRQALRVLKPGSFAFVMSGPRMDCLSEMGKRLAEAGFETGFTPIFWAYASGFPKAANIGKLVDRRRGAEREVVVGKTSHYQTRHGFGGQSWAEPYQEGDATKGRDILAPATPEAQALDGSYAGFQPKPALEVVIVAMKPLSHGTYIDQALDNGHGVTWLDDGRIPYESDSEIDAVSNRSGRGISPTFGVGREQGKFTAQPTGRFPANLLCSDDVLNDGSGYGCTGGAKKSSSSRYWGLPGKGGSHPAGQGTGGFSRFFSLDAWAIANLPESVQRTFPFLIVPKAAKKEKNLGCEDLPEKERCATDYGKGRVRVCNVCGSRTNDLGRGGTWPGCEHNEWDWQEQAGTSKSAIHNPNHHPTVKPLKLMCYLITLGSRPGDLVLDPFAGTCTTGMAAKTLGRDYLMVEQEEEWCQIGRRRIDAVEAKLC